MSFATLSKNRASTWVKLTALKIYYIQGTFRPESMTSTFVVGYRDTCLVLREKIMLDHLNRLQNFIGLLDGVQLRPFVMGGSAKYARLARWVGDTLEGGWGVSVCFRGPWGFSAGGYHFIAENRRLMSRLVSFCEPGLIFLLEREGAEIVTSQLIAAGVPMISLDKNFQDVGREVNTPYFLPAANARAVLFYTRVLVCFFKSTIGSPVTRVRRVCYTVTKLLVRLLIFFY